MTDHTPDDSDAFDRDLIGGSTEREPMPSFAYPTPKSNFRLPFWAKLAVALTVVALASAGFLFSMLRQKPEVSKPRTVELDSPAEIGARETVAPFVLLADDGKATPFANYKGQVVILSFWASWCTPCLLEMPTFSEVEGKFAGRGLKIVAVSVDEGGEGLQAAHDFWKRNAFRFPTFFDGDRHLQKMFKVDMLPSNVVFDRAGRVAFKSYGATDWTGEETLDLLEALVQEGVAEAKPAGAAGTAGAPAGP